MSSGLAFRPGSGFYAAHPAKVAGVALWKGQRTVPRQLDPHQLHHGLSNPPAVRRGDRATRLYRDSDVAITG
jgi:hypothetical protein